MSSTIDAETARWLIVASVVVAMLVRPSIGSVGGMMIMVYGASWREPMVVAVGVLVAHVLGAPRNGGSSGGTPRFG